MKNKYIVRQPIKDAEGKIVGYEILYYGENQAFSNEDTGATSDVAAADTLYTFLTQNSTKVLKGTLNFMTFTTMLLMKKTPRLFDKSELVIQIDDSVIIHPLSMHFVNQYAREGYKIAVNEFRFAPRYLTLMDSIDYIKVNAKTTNDISMHNILEIAHSMNKKCIVTNIDSDELYQKAIAMKADALEGPFVAEKMTMVAHSGAYLQSNFFRLMVSVAKDEPDMEEIEQLIAADANLTYGLMKVANSVYYALRHRATTIKQAVMTLGMGQLKQWIYLLGSGSGKDQIDPAAEEFLKLSFMRANFCSELMNYAQNMPISKSEAYLMGMFSTLNYLIEAPIEEILAEVPVDEAIKAALINQEGRCGMLYALVLSYETADWSKITTLAEELEIPNHLLTSIYFNCMEGVNMLWDQLTSPYITENEQAESVGQEQAMAAAGSK